MRKLVVLTALIVSGVCGTSTAEAHMLKLKSHASDKQKYLHWQQSENHAAYNIKHYTKVIQWFHKNRRWTLKSADILTRLDAHAAYGRALAQVRAHRWLLKVSQLNVWNLRFLFPPPHHSGWLCIHSYEGSWQDPNDPFWGGLQMDRSFMRSYAPSYPLRNLLRIGFADRWTPLEQEWVAEFAYNSGRGYTPWPNTARYCGLL